MLSLLSLLSNCTKWSTNNVRIQYKYPAILYGYLDSWLFCTERKLFNQSAARATLLYPLCFTRLMRNEEKDSAENKEVGLYNFLDILVCSIAEYLCDLCKTQTTKILSYTTHQNVQYEILIDCFLTCFVLFFTVVSFCCFGLSTFRVINGFWGNHIINTKRITLN